MNARLLAVSKSIVIKIDADHNTELDLVRMTYSHISKTSQESNNYRVSTPLKLWQKILIGDIQVYMHIIRLSLNMIQMTPTRSKLEVLGLLRLKKRAVRILFQG
jgi:hypothetical protein